MTHENNDHFTAKCMEIFFPYHATNNLRVEKSKTNFVHYTTAEAAMNMLQSKEIWLRQPYFMNDYHEIEHGMRCLISIYEDEEVNFKNLLNSYHQDITNEIETAFNSVIQLNREDIYLFCISEHMESENKHGRLSMWRAYGKEIGVAIVLKSETILTPSPGTGALISPVAYQSNSEFSLNFKQIVQNIKDNDTFIKELSRDQFKNVIVQMFRISVLSTKHIGFAEEKEWRIIYSPSLEKSSVMKHEIEKLNGIPQEVCKLPLVNDESLGLNKIALNDSIERIIIGPTNYPFPLYKAFVKLLTQAGVEDAGAKVHISDIPLRV